uniref:Armadillo repeat-containing domain-containing protein n=1 Tax=Brassica oleracea var. oleracea TaxID=109376 RepID=A0A0D3CDX5_BRAOL
MAIPVVPYTMVKLSRAVSKKQRTIRCQCLECDSSGKYKRSLFKKISNFSTWSNLTLVLLWVVIIFLIYYTKNMSREVHIAQRGAITPLIKTLQSSDEQVVEMSAFALGRLAQENLADFIKAGGIQRLQDDNFTVQPTRDCVVRTLKRLDNKIHGPVFLGEEFVNNPTLSDVTFPIHDTTFNPILCFC